MEIRLSRRRGNVQRAMGRSLVCVRSELAKIRTDVTSRCDTEETARAELSVRVACDVAQIKTKVK